VNSFSLVHIRDSAGVPNVIDNFALRFIELNRLESCDTQVLNHIFNTLLSNYTTPNVEIPPLKSRDDVANHYGSGKNSKAEEM